MPVGTPPPGQVLPVVDGAQARRRRCEAESAPAATAMPRRRCSGAFRCAWQPESRADAPAHGATGTPLVPTEEGDFWHATVQQLVAAEAITALVRELALQSQLVARDADHWMLRVERESLNQPTSRERLQTALQRSGHARAA